MCRQESCPNCGRPLDRTYTWRKILRCLLCRPCELFCVRCRPTDYCVYHCKICDIKVVCARGGVPDFARRYRLFKDFSWQFEAPPRDDRTNSATTVAYRRAAFRRGGDLPVNFSASTQLSYATANENFENDSAASFRTTTTALTTPPVVENNKNNKGDNKHDCNNNNRHDNSNNKSQNRISGNNENYRTANEEFVEKAKEITKSSTSHDNNNMGGIRNEALEVEDSVQIQFQYGNV